MDEIEKAHEDVWNILLQILDDGRITDSQGRTVDFKNTVIVMTSNIGAKALTNAGAKLGTDAGEKEDGADADKAYEEAKETVMGELRRTFRPEFLNRIDDIIVFRALTEQDNMARVPCAGPFRARWRTLSLRRCWMAPSRRAIPPSLQWRMANWSYRDEVSSERGRKVNLYAKAGRNSSLLLPQNRGEATSKTRPVDKLSPSRQNRQEKG